jgi:hypothetical protein
MQFWTAPVLNFPSISSYEEEQSSVSSWELSEARKIEACSAFYFQ